MILLADDNDILRVTLTRQLAELGYVSHSVSSGEELLECLKGNAYHLILLDVALPVMDGFEVTKRIRLDCQVQQRPHIPIVALTGVARKDDCMNAGMDGFLHKPVSLDDLREITQKWAPQPEHEQLDRISPVLSDLLKHERLLRGLTQAELASRADLTVGQVEIIEAGEEHLSIMHLIKFGLGLGMTASELIEGAERRLHNDGSSQN